MTVGVRRTTTCTCVYFCLYVYKQHFSFIQPNDIYGTLNGHYCTLRWLCIGTNGRPSLSAFIFVYKGLITKNVYRDEIKRAQTAWKAITCVCVCVYHTVSTEHVCVDNYYNVCASMFPCRRKVAYKEHFKLPVWGFVRPPQRAEVMMHSVINCRLF